MSDDKKWEREQDANTLTRATVIKLNPKKLKAAFGQLKMEAKAKNRTLIDVKKLFKNK